MLPPFFMVHYIDLPLFIIPDYFENERILYPGITHLVQYFYDAGLVRAFKI